MATCSTEWKLDRYARSKQTQQQEKKPHEGNWEYFDDSEKTLQATLKQESYFIISHGSVIMESINLINSRSWIRGTTKGDSMLIVSKLAEGTRRCRIKFVKSEEKTGEDMCKECGSMLSQYFPLKIISSVNTTVPNQEGTNGNEKEQVVTGEVTLGDMAKILTRESKQRLPAAYQRFSTNSEQDVDTILRLCLTDPTFPAFVADIEQKLNEIKQENN